MEGKKFTKIEIPQNIKPKLENLENKKLLGLELKKIREKTGKSIAGLAGELSHEFLIDADELSDWENGISISPSYKEVVRFATHCGVEGGDFQKLMEVFRLLNQ